MNDPNGMFFIGQFDGHKFTCEDEPSETKWMDYGKVRQLRIFVDRCSVEAFDGDGKMCMTNLVFPSTPYDKIIVKGKAKATIYKIKTKNWCKIAEKCYIERFLFVSETYFKA